MPKSNGGKTSGRWHVYLTAAEVAIMNRAMTSLEREIAQLDLFKENVEWKSDFYRFFSKIRSQSAKMG